MTLSLEELVGSYVARTETPGSPYFGQLVRSLSSRLRAYGYSDESSGKHLRMTIRRLLTQEREKAAAAALAKAKSFAPAEAEDLAQDAWLEALENSQLKAPEGSGWTWAGRLKQMRSPVSVPLRIAKTQEWQSPDALELTDATEYEAQEISVPEAELEIDIRDAFESLDKQFRHDLRDLIIQEEPLAEFAQRKGISLFEAAERHRKAVEALQESFDDES